MRNKLLLLATLLLAIATSTSAQNMARSSKFKGVQLGATTYSYRSMPGKSLEDILEYAVASGLNSVELKGEAVEAYLGVPTEDKDGSVRAFRGNVATEKGAEIGKMFAERGVNIHIFKLSKPNWSDEEIDYTFRLGKAMGAKGISMEYSYDAAEKYAPFAERYGMYVIFHNHFQSGDPKFTYEKAFAVSKNVMLNFDMGHYFGATGINPARFVERYHDRIFSIHFKDKTDKFNTVKPNANQPFGEGETQIKDVLHLIRDNKYPIHCDIELEYKIPAGSDAVKEVEKCINYCAAFLNEK